MRSGTKHIAGDHHQHSGWPRQTSAFTLLEGLLASMTLALLVLGVGAAVSAAQNATMEGQKQIMATIVADDFASELMSLKYTDLAMHNGDLQNVGQLKTFDGDKYPKSYNWLGRRVSVNLVSITNPSLMVTIVGQRIIVTAFDNKRDLATVELFVPEPPK